MQRRPDQIAVQLQPVGACRVIQFPFCIGQLSLKSVLSPAKDPGGAGEEPLSPEEKAAIREALSR